MGFKELLAIVLFLNVQAKNAEQNYLYSPVPLPFTGQILSGLLIGIFLIAIFICGFLPLFSIQTPEDFARHPLAVGKES